jgi:hypothetical protein
MEKKGSKSTTFLFCPKDSSEEFGFWIKKLAKDKKDKRNQGPGAKNHEPGAKPLIKCKM